MYFWNEELGHTEFGRLFSDFNDGEISVYTYVGDSVG